MKKLLSLLLVLVTMLALLTSCGAATKADFAPMERDEAYNSAAGEKYYYATDSKDVMYEEAMTEAAINSSYPTATEAPQVERKQIKNVLLRLQTKEYDSFMESLSASVSHFGGYISMQRESGNSYNEISNRYCSMEVKIPAANLSDFLSGVSDISNVTYRHESISDVTEAYIDIESRIAVLKAEESSLLSMLESAQNHLDDGKMNYSEIIDTMMYIKDKLLYVQSDLASYEAQLKSLSSRVAYSTVTLEINEVERFVAVEKKLGLWEEIGEKLSNNLYYIGEGFRNFFVWFITSLPYLLMWAVAIAVIVLVLRKILKYIDKKDSALKRSKTEKNTDNGQDGNKTE